MCGIAGIHRLTDKPIKRLDAFVDGMLDSIESRGYDATGYAAIFDDGSVSMQKASCQAQYFAKLRRPILGNPRTVLLHTRWATQGDPAFPENNHPVESGGILCIHNGHISNDSRIFQEIGRPRIGRVDSEAIPAIVAEFGLDHAAKALEELHGDYAVALATPKVPRTLVLAKGPTSPLVYVKTKDYIVWASTSEAIRTGWKAALGTPPAYGKNHWLTSGDLLYIRDGEVRPSRFAPVEPAWKIQQTTSSQTPYMSTETKEEAKVVDILPDIREDYTLAQLAAAEEDSWPDQRQPRDSFEIDGELFLRCDDCGDYFEQGELQVTTVMGGVSNSLCPSCMDWAGKAGILG